MGEPLSQHLVLGVNAFGGMVIERVRALPLDANIVYHRLEAPREKPVAQTYLEVRKRLLDVLNREVYNFANCHLSVYLVGLMIEEHLAADLMHLGYLFKTFFRENIILNPRVKLVTALSTILPEEAYGWLPSTRRTLEQIDNYAALREQFQPAYAGLKRSLPAISGPPWDDVVFCYSESLDVDDLEVSAQAAATKIYFDLAILPRRMASEAAVSDFYRGLPAGQGFLPVAGSAVAFLPSLGRLVRDEMEYLLMMRLCERFFPTGPTGPTGPTAPPAPGAVEKRVDEVLRKVHAERLGQLVEAVVRHALENERWFDLAAIDAIAKYDIEISPPPDAYLQRFVQSLEHERNRFAGRVRDLALEWVLRIPERLKDCLATDYHRLNLWEIDSLFTNAFFRVKQLLDQRSSLEQQLRHGWQRTRSDLESKIGRLKGIASEKSARLKRGSDTEVKIQEVFGTVKVREILEQSLGLTVAEGLLVDTALEGRLREGYDRIHGQFAEFLKKRESLMAHLHNRRDAYLRRREMYLYVFNQVFRQRLLDAAIDRRLADLEKAASDEALERGVGAFFFKRWLAEPELPFEEVEASLMEAIRLEARAAIEKIASEMQVDYRDVVRILQDIADAQVNSIFDQKYKEHPRAAYRQAMFLCHKDEKLAQELYGRKLDGIDLTDMVLVPDLPYQVLQVMEIYNLPFKALRQYGSLEREPDTSPSPGEGT